MAFVNQQEVLDTFEGLIKFLFKKILKTDFPKPFPVISYSDAIEKYGSDKPDLRFEMELSYLEDLAKGKGFKVFDESESIVAINVPGAAEYSRKKLDELTNWVKRPQIGARGLVYVKYNEDHTFKSSIDKFYDPSHLKQWAERCGAKIGRASCRERV